MRPVRHLEPGDTRRRAPLQQLEDPGSWAIGADSPFPLTLRNGSAQIAEEIRDLLFDLYWEKTKRIAKEIAALMESSGCFVEEIEKDIGVATEYARSVRSEVEAKIRRRRPKLEQEEIDEELRYEIVRKSPVEMGDWLEEILFGKGPTAYTKAFILCETWLSAENARTWIECGTEWFTVRGPLDVKTCKACQKRLKRRVRREDIGRWPPHFGCRCCLSPDVTYSLNHPSGNKKTKTAGARSTAPMPSADAAAEPPSKWVPLFAICIFALVLVIGFALMRH